MVSKKNIVHLLLVKINAIKGIVMVLLPVLAKAVPLQTALPNEQSSQLFAAYKKDKKHSPLPDFSYAGYHCGAAPIPVVTNYKVFNVLDFGAKPDDDISDRQAIEAAIIAANKNGSGIVFFPKGRFLVNEDSAVVQGIFSKGGNIIFRGSGSGPEGTELFMKYPLLPADPEKMWTGAPMFTFTAKGKDSEIGAVVESAGIGTFKLRLNSTEHLCAGDWIALKMLNNAPALIAEELGGNNIDTAWTYLLKKGVDVCMYYKVVRVAEDYIQLHAPLAYNVDVKYSWNVYKFANAEEVGIEDIAFVGNWKEKFVHHKSWIHDSGFELLVFNRCTNSWIKNCRFTDCSVAALVKQSANVTVRNCLVNGNAGHQAITSNHSTNVLLSGLTDSAAQFHSFGVSNGAINTVIWRCTYPATTSFETHGGQPRNTLLDNVTGGLLQNHGGGAIENMPNHMRGLVFWNYKQTNAPVKNFDFWPEGCRWWKIPVPIIAGFMGNGTGFIVAQLQALEGLDQVVTPSSLYEAQLALRLEKMPGS